jgi:enamine deaminase RidA (YjgF/YER057c/UK114 family)
VSQAGGKLRSIYYQRKSALHLRPRSTRCGSNVDDRQSRREVTLEDAYARARLVGINLLSVAHHAKDGLGGVRRLLKLTGFVNASDDFRDHPKVINGCSDLMVEVFGDAGKHARSAVGVSSLPGNISVEIEAIFEIV